MKARAAAILASSLCLLALACVATPEGAQDTGVGESGEEEDVSSSEDGLTSNLKLRELTNLQVPNPTSTVTRKVFSSLASAKTFFGSSAVLPKIDFSKEWLVFYGAGRQNSGGYKASVKRAWIDGNEVRIATNLETPGKDCAVTMAITNPFTLVAIEAPKNVSWVRYYTSTKAVSCSADLKCEAMLCAPGTYCEETSGAAKCVSYPTCASTSCPVGTQCEERAIKCVKAPCPPTAPACVPSKPTVSCANVRCAAGTYCDDSDGSASCLSYSTCANVKCGFGTVCIDEPVQCVTTPCPPTSPRCVAPYTCPKESYINCMPGVGRTTDARCSGPEHAWITANCPKTIFVY